MGVEVGVRDTEGVTLKLGVALIEVLGVAVGVKDSVGVTEGVIEVEGVREYGTPSPGTPGTYRTLEPI